MEQISFFTKVRFVAAMGIAAVLFWFIALPLARPEMPGGTLLLVQHSRTIPVLIVIAILALIVPAASLLCNPYLRYMAALAAAPVGLAVLALWTAGLAPALADIAIEERGQLFRSMLVDLLLWSGVAWLGVVAARLAVKEPMRGLLTAETEPQTPGRKKTNQAAIINAILGLLIVAVLAYLLLRILIQSGQVQIAGTEMISPPPQKGQIVFGLIAAFGLATLGVHQLFSMRVEWLLLTVLIVGLAVLIPNRPIDVSTSTLLASTCVPSSQLLKTITPLAWVAFGTIGVLWGYWASVRLRYARFHLAETA